MPTTLRTKNISFNVDSAPPCGDSTTHILRYPKINRSGPNEVSFGEYSFATATKSASSACHKTRASTNLMIKAYHSNSFKTSVLTLFFKFCIFSSVKKHIYAISSAISIYKQHGFKAEKCSLPLKIQ